MFQITLKVTPICLIYVLLCSIEIKSLKTGSDAKLYSLLIKINTQESGKDVNFTLLLIFILII